MNLRRRLARLESERGPTIQVIGIMRENQDDALDGVTVWPGGSRLSYAEFAQRYPRGTLCIINNFGSESDENQVELAERGG